MAGGAGEASPHREEPQDLQRLARAVREAVPRGAARAVLAGDVAAALQRAGLGPWRGDDPPHGLGPLPAFVRAIPGVATAVNGDDADGDAELFYLVSDAALLGALEATPADAWEGVLGEALYPRVEALGEPAAAHAPQITGMLLEMETSDILNLLEDPRALAAKVAEALEVLRDAGALAAAEDEDGGGGGGGGGGGAEAAGDSPKIEFAPVAGEEAPEAAPEAEAEAPAPRPQPRGGARAAPPPPLRPPPPRAGPGPVGVPMAVPMPVPMPMMVPMMVPGPGGALVPVMVPPPMPMPGVPGRPPPRVQEQVVPLPEQGRLPWMAGGQTVKVVRQPLRLRRRQPRAGGGGAAWGDRHALSASAAAFVIGNREVTEAEYPTLEGPAGAAEGAEEDYGDEEEAAMAARSRSPSPEPGRKTLTFSFKSLKAKKDQLTKKPPPPKPKPSAAAPPEQAAGRAELQAEAAPPPPAAKEDLLSKLSSQMAAPAGGGGGAAPAAQQQQGSLEDLKKRLKAERAKIPQQPAKKQAEAPEEEAAPAPAPVPATADDIMALISDIDALAQH